MLIIFSSKYDRELFKKVALSSLSPIIPDEYGRNYYYFFDREICRCASGYSTESVRIAHFETKSPEAVTIHSCTLEKETLLGAGVIEGSQGEEGIASPVREYANR
jgi:hypothetical protein